MAKRIQRPTVATQEPSKRGSPEAIEVIARGLIQAGSRVLLCRNRKHGYLYLPGGHVECNESAAAACAREIREEIGWLCAAGPLLLVTEQLFTQNNRRRHEYTLVFHVEHTGGADAPNPPSLEPKIAFEWVDLASLPDLDVRPEAVKAWLVAGGDLGGSDRPGWIPHHA